MLAFKAAAAAALVATASAAGIVNTQSSLTFLYQNNLNASDNYNHGRAILMDSMSYTAAQSACSTINETLITKAYVQQYKDDFIAQLGYVEYAGYTSDTQMFWIAEGVVGLVEGDKSFTFSKAKKYMSSSFPVLCSQNQGVSNYGGSATSGNSLAVSGADGNIYTGYRNLKSFRFLGLRFAQNPGRFRYTTPYMANSSNITATTYGPQCKQYGSGSEDCFFLNIFTPYIPKAGSKQNLRAVHFWIYGGGFTSGSGSGYDSGDLASREDIVTVTINYRLGNAGFLAVPGTDAAGNYGIGDQITALQWVIANIAKFGGDPNQITIAGQSAGAGSVRTLLGSPKAIGKFQGAIAISNLGGGRSLGLNGNYGTTYSSYYTIAQSYAVSGVASIFTLAGCNQTTLQAQVNCLRNDTSLDLSTLAATARYVVQDGVIVNTEDLEVQQAGPNVAQIPVIFGTAENDGAAIGSGYSKTCTTELQCIEQNLYISAAYAQAVIDSGLFPLYNTGNITADSFNVTQRIATDITFRCADQATMYAASQSGAFSKSYYYQSNRGFPGDAYNPNNVDITGNISAAFPLGDPSTFYYKVHSSDLPSLFGTYGAPRAPSDIYSMQLTTGYFGAFIKTGNPNPAIPELKIRQYKESLNAVQKTGPWNEVSSLTGPMKILDYPAKTAVFTDTAQCSWLNISTSYYLQGGM